MKASRCGTQTIDAEDVEVEVLDADSAPTHRTPPARMPTGRAVIARRWLSPLLLLAVLPSLLLLAVLVVIAAAVAVLWLLARAMVRRLRLLLH